MNNSVQVSGSLRNKLAITLLGGVTLLTVLFYFVVRDYTTKIAQQSQDSILNASVTSMLDKAVIRHGEVEIDIPYSALSMLSTPTDDRVFYAIYQDGNLLSGYENLLIPKDEDNEKSTPRSTTFMNVPVRQVSSSRILVGADLRTRISATVAQTQESLSGTLSEISRNAALYGAGFFAFAAMLSVWAASSTIGPLKRFADSVARRGPQDLRPIAKPVPSEMVPLVSSFNNLMGSLEKSFSQSEEFIAEAAHRVRTPLSTVRSYAETTLQRVDKEDNRQALRAMIRAIDESSRAATQVLDHAMITFRAKQLEYQEIDLVDMVENIVMRLTPLAEMKEIELRMGGENIVRVSGEPILIQNAVRNIIDNALKYSPAESVVVIKVSASPSPCVEVRDQGNGFPSDEIETLTERFTRGRNANDSIGSGLGLTIARDVAVAHGGTLTISNGEGGGACVYISF